MVEKRFEKLGMPDIERFENYLPTAFNSELTLLQKVNKIIFDLMATNKLTNEMVDYLNKFIETFDEKLYKTIDDILTKWLEDGILAELIRDTINEEVKLARKPLNKPAYPLLGDRLNAMDEDVANLDIKLNKKIDGFGINILDYQYLVQDNDWTSAFKLVSELGYPIIVPNKGSNYTLKETIYLKSSLIGVNNPIIEIVNTKGQETKRMFVVNDFSNGHLTIEGLHLIGDYDGGELGEQAHFIRIGSSHNIHVVNNIFERPYGDCVYIGNSDSSNPSTNIVVRGNIMLNPRRCCVAVVNVKKTLIEGNIFNDNNGFVAVIDIEPNKVGLDVVEDCVITNNIVHTTYYFINILNPISTIIKGVTIENNKGTASLFIRASRGSHEDIKVLGNQFEGSGRFLLIADVKNILIKDNIDEGSESGQLSRCNGCIVSNNSFHIKNSVDSAFVFSDCNDVHFSGNTLNGSKSIGGSLHITGVSEVPLKNYLITNNIVVDSDYGVNISIKILNAIFDGNIVESDRRGINVTSSAAVSDLHVGLSNKFTGDGTPVVGYDNILKWTNPEVRIKGVGVYWRSTLPTSGDWVRGDIIYKINPISGNFIGWVCVTSGEPGVWKEFGSIL